MKGSGKQILMAVLQDLSTRQISDAELGEATARIRAALLWHGSSSEDNFRCARALEWASKVDEHGLVLQGPAVQNGRVHLLDFFEEMWNAPGLKEHMRNKFKGLSDQDYEAVYWGLWCLISHTHMYAELLPVEAANNDELELEKWIGNMKEKYQYFFEHGPESS